MSAQMENLIPHKVVWDRKMEEANDEVEKYVHKNSREKHVY